MRPSAPPSSWGAVTKALARRLPIGAEWSAEYGAHFRVWAPDRRGVEVVLEGPEGALLGRALLEREQGGYFSGGAPGARPGSLYRYALDGEATLFPDPASRFQPRGPLGPSLLVDPGTFAWRVKDWPGARLEGQVVYELHVGTFTPEGTWDAAGDRLSELAALGVTLLEVMPIADFPGRFGWGYDGVCLFAPTRLYGTPDAFRRFVDRAHAARLGVILDVVYNHLGPSGNCLPRFSSAYMSDRSTQWGQALNFDGPGSKSVREFFIANAVYWIDEFRLDGLRLDAVQDIFDSSKIHVVAELGAAARAAAGERTIVIVAEHEGQDARLARPRARGGLGLDAVWNDDFHHAARVALTGEREAYYSDYLGTPQELLSCLLRGYLYQGQFYAWQGKIRGTPAGDLAPAAFVHYLENHDQAANSLDGRRLHQLCDPGRYRALTALLLLGPQTPMLFMGQEFGATSPFLYFADHAGELGAAVRAGRRTFLNQFPRLAALEAVGALSDPLSPSTFARCKLDYSERVSRPEAYALHRDLLRLRQEDPVFRSRRLGGLAGAVLTDAAFALRYTGARGHPRLLVLNLGPESDLQPPSEPLLAMPADASWELLWSSEHPDYGGSGALCPVDAQGRWRLPAAATCVLRPTHE